METALVLVLDDSEPFDAVRREFDADTVARGVPFHVTLLYPFAPREELTDEVLAETRSFFAARRPLAFALTRIASWPEVVYAVPEPDAELRDCMQALHALFRFGRRTAVLHDTVRSAARARPARRVDVRRAPPAMSGA